MIPLFRPKGGRSVKIECTVCGRSGYPWGDLDEPPVGHWWATTCLRGHAPCPRCGKSLAVLVNGKPRTHAHCANTPIST